MQFQQTYTVKFIKKIYLTEDIATYYFEKPSDFSFLAGQYNRWTLPYHITDGQGTSRFFTISSSPLDKHYLTFTTKNGHSGFKKTLLRLNPDDEIKIFGPMGTLIYEEHSDKSKVFLSGGMGITPFYSMVKYAQEIETKQPLTLIASFSNLKEVIYYSDLTKIAQNHKNITIVYTISRQEENDTNINVEKGRITAHLLTKYVPDMNNTLFYVVGGIETETALKELLLESRIAEENIITEQFTGY